jgi:hypothetical protein
MSIYIPQLNAYAIDEDGDGGLDKLALNQDDALLVLQDSHQEEDSLVGADIAVFSEEVRTEYFGVSEGSLADVDINGLQRYVEAIDGAHHAGYKPLEWYLQQAIAGNNTSTSNKTGYPNAGSYAVAAIEAGRAAGLEDSFMHPMTADYFEMVDYIAATLPQAKPQGAERVNRREAPDQVSTNLAWIELVIEGESEGKMRLREDMTVKMSPKAWEAVERLENFGRASASGHKMGPYALSDYALDEIIGCAQSFQVLPMNNEAYEQAMDNLAGMVADFFILQNLYAQHHGTNVGLYYWSNQAEALLALPADLQRRVEAVYAEETSYDLYGVLADGKLQGLQYSQNMKLGFVRRALDNDGVQVASGEIAGSSGYAWMYFEEATELEEEIIELTGQPSSGLDFVALAEEISAVYREEMPEHVENMFARTVAGEI